MKRDGRSLSLTPVEFSDPALADARMTQGGGAAAGNRTGDLG